MNLLFFYIFRIINKFAVKLNMPILSAIYSIIYENFDPKSMADKLMSRPIKREDFF